MAMAIMETGWRGHMKLAHQRCIAPVAITMVGLEEGTLHPHGHGDHGRCVHSKHGVTNWLYISRGVGHQW